MFYVSVLTERTSLYFVVCHASIVVVLLPCSVAYLCVPADYDGGHDSDNLEVDNVDSSAPGDAFVCGIEREEREREKRVRERKQYHDLYRSTGRLCMSSWSHVNHGCDYMPS